jgi:hypothetical protein
MVSYDALNRLTRADSLRRIALITVAAVSATMFSTLQMVSTRYGLGQDIDDISSGDLAAGVKVLCLSDFTLKQWHLTYKSSV